MTWEWWFARRDAMKKRIPARTEVTELGSKMLGLEVWWPHNFQWRRYVFQLWCKWMWLSCYLNNTFRSQVTCASFVVSSLTPAWTFSSRSLCLSSRWCWRNRPNWTDLYWVSVVILRYRNTRTSVVMLLLEGVSPSHRCHSINLCYVDVLTATPPSFQFRVVLYHQANQAITSIIWVKPWLDWTSIYFNQKKCCYLRYFGIE